MNSGARCSEGTAGISAGRSRSLDDLQLEVSLIVTLSERDRSVGG